MKHLLFAGLVLLVAACNNASPKEEDSSKAVVKEVHQAGVYTYLLVDQNRKDIWIAVPAMEARAGETYFFEGGLEMTDFESKELGRTFESVLFVEEISKTPLEGQSNVMGADMMEGMMEDGTVHAGRVDVDKKNIQMEHAEGEITIAALFANKQEFDGQTIRVRGEVTKFNSAIMDRNWVHLQDGTEYEGHFDLTATTSLDFEVGSTVVLEGTVSIDKDFGYGYVYEILLENAVVAR